MFKVIPPKTKNVNHELCSLIMFYGFGVNGFQGLWGHSTKTDGFLWKCYSFSLVLDRVWEMGQGDYFRVIGII